MSRTYKPKPPCVSCKKAPSYGSSPLCRSCRTDVAICKRHGVEYQGYIDPLSQEEVDRIIAEQMANLPEWWEREDGKPHVGEQEQEPYIKAIVRMKRTGKRRAE